MEQLNELIKFSANVKDEKGAIHPFSFTVSDPVVEDEYSAYCMLACPYLREKAFKIIGTDEDQAIELSLHFVTNMLEGQHLIDNEGAPLSLPTWPEA